MAPTKGPTIAELIGEAIENLRVKGSSKGVSRTAIKNYIGDRSTPARINLSLKRMVTKEELVQVRDSFKFSPKHIAAEKKKVASAEKKKKEKATAKPKKTAAAKPKKTTASKKKKATKPKKASSTKKAGTKKAGTKKSTTKRTTKK
eukprot:gene1966-5050_t